MKVLLINGSPRVGGNTSIALGEMEKIFQESLDRAGLEYYDFYLLHAMSAERVAKAD